MWQVVCIQENREQVIFMTDNEDAANAKADRLNKHSPASIKYEVREVEDE